MKKLLVYILSVLMICFFCSCGGGENLNPQETQTPQELYDIAERKLQQAFDKMEGEALEATDNYGLQIDVQAGAGITMGENTIQVSADVLLQLLLDFENIVDSKALVEVQAQVPGEGGMPANESISAYIIDDYLYTNSPEGKFKNALNLANLNFTPGENYIQDVIALFKEEAQIEEILAELPFDLNSITSFEDIIALIKESEGVNPIMMVFLDQLEEIELYPYQLFALNITNTKITATFNYDVLKSLFLDAANAFLDEISAFTDEQADFKNKISADERFVEYINMKAFSDVITIMNSLDIVFGSFFTGIDDPDFIALANYTFGKDTWTYADYSEFIMCTYSDWRYQERMAEWLYDNIGADEFCEEANWTPAYQDNIDWEFEHLYYDMLAIPDKVNNIIQCLPTKFDLVIEIGFTDEGLLQSFDIDLDVALKLPSNTFDDSAVDVTLVDVSTTANISIDITTGITADRFEFPIDFDNYELRQQVQ